MNATTHGLLHGLFSLLLLSLVAVEAATDEAMEIDYVELQQRYVRYHTSYYVNDDYTVETLNKFEMQALTQNAVKGLKSSSFSYSTSIEQFEVLEAYTLKSDGLKIAVPADNYQLNINKGNRDGGPVYSDRSRITVVFPDLAVGDSIVLRTRRTETEPMFPGQVALAQYFWSQVAFDDVSVSIDLPESMAFNHQVRDMEERIVTSNGRTQIQLGYRNEYDRICAVDSTSNSELQELQACVAALRDEVSELKKIRSVA